MKCSVGRCSRKVLTVRDVTLSGRRVLAEVSIERELLARSGTYAEAPGGRLPLHGGRVMEATAKRSVIYGLNSRLSTIHWHLWYMGPWTQQEVWCVRFGGLGRPTGFTSSLICRFRVPSSAFSDSSSRLPRIRLQASLLLHSLTTLPVVDGNDGAGVR
jgi:hypothetical protein